VTYGAPAMTRHRRTCRGRLAATGAIAAIALAVTPGIASAHVTVHPDHLVRGATDVELTFRCPNERDAASTTELRVFLPTATPLLGVLTTPQPGWSSKVTTVRLAHPVETDDGEISVAASEITWTATAGGIAPGQYEDFDVAVGTMPDVVGPLVFKALQTYSNGEVVRWIEVPDALDESPENPAPSLTLTAPATASSSTSTPLAVAALACAALALLGVVTQRRRRSG